MLPHVLDMQKHVPPIINNALVVSYGHGKVAPMISATSIKDALKSSAARDSVLVRGWVRTRRDSKTFSFIELNDGSSLRSLQIIANDTLPNYAEIQRLTTGAALAVHGKLIASQGKGQSWEVVADQVDIVGASDESYPLQKKGHTPEFLREIAHLRPRSNLFGSVFRVRSRLAFAIHQFFQERGFFYLNTPIITGSDCEGAGELFRVTSIDPKSPPKTADGNIDYAKDFFARQTYLTVSGQLEAEAFACALSKVYTFGPTFPRGELEHVTSCQRILDDRTRNGVLRSGGQHGRRGRDREIFDSRHSRKLSGRIRALLEVCRQGIDRAP